MTNPKLFSTDQIDFAVYTQMDESEIKYSRFGHVNGDFEPGIYLKWELRIRKLLNPESFVV